MTGCRYVLPGGECSLDIADDGEHTLEQVARALGSGLSRERIRQVEVIALRKVRRRLELAGVASAEDWTNAEEPGGA